MKDDLDIEMSNMKTDKKESPEATEAETAIKGIEESTAKKGEEMSPIKEEPTDAQGAKKEEAKAPASEPSKAGFCGAICKIWNKHRFLIMVVSAIALAYAYPPIGMTYLAPHITASWIAVVIIFVMSGLSIKTRELKKALGKMKFNAFVQIFNLGFVPAVTYGISRAMSPKLISHDLADGMVIGASLPMTVNMVIVMTKSAAGDEACALLNATVGNMLGVLVTPALILVYLGQSSDINFGKVVMKLVYRVVIPIIVGQILQFSSKTVVAFATKHKPTFGRIQELCLVFIVYTVFCKTFGSPEPLDATIGQVIVLFIVVILLVLFFMATSWVIMRCLFKNEPKLVIMGFFGCHHKTVAMGLPLIKAIYEDDPRLGLYALPLLLWHPF